MNAYFLGHNGLGDNLYSIGSLRFLLNFYDKIYFLCKNKYYENVKLFFLDTDRIICVPFDSSQEVKDCSNIINSNYDNNDIFICGFYHKRYLKSKITNKDLLNYKLEKNIYNIDYDMITTANYGFIENFYKDIKLNISIMFDYWKLPTTQESINLYESIKQYNIIFLQTKSSNNKRLNITNLVDKYLYDVNTILISYDENLYNNANIDISNIIIKKNICNNFVNNKIVYYLDTIINSKEIYIIDSCFVGIVLPLKKTNKLKADIVRIILRNESNNIIL